METKNLSIHIIEEDKSFGNLSALLLKKQGFFNIKSFHSAQMYIDTKAYEEKPDVALTDFYLDNKITGCMILDLLKTHSNKTQVIFMSSFIDNKEVVESVKKEVVATLSKNENFCEELISTMNEIWILFSNMQVKN